MHIPTHILSGWVAANLLPLDARSRLCCMIAASAADLDGFGFFFSETMYWRFHHVGGHNLFAGLAGSIVLALFARTRRWLTFAACLAVFHLHLLMDLYGSGFGWRIYYLWPVDNAGFKTDAAWALSSWQNYLAFGVLLLLTIVIAIRKRRTPLELIAPRFERMLVGRE